MLTDEVLMRLFKNKNVTDCFCKILSVFYLEIRMNIKYDSNNDNAAYKGKINFNKI